MAEKPVANRMSHPKPCCGVFRDLEAQNCIIWTKSQNFVFSFDCDYVGAAVKPLRYCPHCGFEWRTQGTING